MKSITRRSLTALFTTLGLAAALAAGAADAPAKIRMLMLTGDDVTPAHNWRETTPAVREVLDATKKFEIKVCEDTAILESASALQRYDVLYLNLYNAKTPTLSEAAKANLLAFVKGGKGIVVSHLASASFKEWTEFQKLCGRYWVMGKSGHGPRSTFKVKITDTAHPITKGLEPFETDDELYAKMQGSEAIQVLAEADSDWSKQTEPLAFVLKYGEGRVFHHTFGHDGKAIKVPSVAQIIARGSEWAAKGQVQ